jgi:hypothetical protein
LGILFLVSERGQVVVKLIFRHVGMIRFSLRHVQWRYLGVLAVMVWISFVPWISRLFMLLSSRDGVLIRDLMDNGTDRRGPSRRRFIHAA